MRLLNVDEALYIPITQEPAPMTEDMLEEHAEVLAKLGTSAEGAHLRARMQSACLLSDMEAFKAANPGSVLGDFVRWYSPRDWMEEEQVDEEGNVTIKGQLSPRMQIPGNMWAEVWQSAKPIPVRRQKRLFDDTKEAEKVLHYLAAMKPAEAALRLMPMLINAAIAKLLEQEESSIPVVKNLINTIITRATKSMRAARHEIKQYENLIRQIDLTEVLITRAQSLKTKFCENGEQESCDNSEVLQFIGSLLEQQPEVSILGAARGPIGSIIHNLFATAQKSQYMLPEDTEDEELDLSVRTSSSGIKSDFPIPAGKEYILRTTVPRSAPWSRPSPQHMFCVIQKDEFRLAGAFSADTTFQ